MRKKEFCGSVKETVPTGVWHFGWIGGKKTLVCVRSSSSGGSKNKSAPNFCIRCSRKKVFCDNAFDYKLLLLLSTPFAVVVNSSL
jgi:hypothetical protein